MPAKPLLLLAGTTEAREAAALLIAAGFAPTSSMAGVTSNPILPPGAVRQGGFGSVEGMVQVLREMGAVAVVDASHPFAARISATAVEAAARAGIPCLRLERPAWIRPEGANWLEVQTIIEAAQLIPAGATVLVTTGSKTTAPFTARDDVTGFIRSIEPLRGSLPPNWQHLMERPPFDLAHERQLFADKAITVLVTKNSGGERMRAKLDAAQEKKIPVVMVQRPAKPPTETIWPPYNLVARLAATIIA